MTARATKAEKAIDPLDEAELDRILPPIDESDPEWQAYVRRKVRESLDDPRPSIPAEEVRRRMLERHQAYLKRGT
jgi:PaaA2-like antitoxin